MIEPRDNSAKGVFGRLQVRLDPWQPEFGPEFAGFDEMAADGPESVDIELERPRDHWEPIDPELNWPLEHPVWFIDGVRRLEARVTAKLDGQYSYGAFGAYGVRWRSTSCYHVRMLTTPENLAQVVLQSLRNSSADDSETTMFTIRLKRDLDAFYRSLSNHADIRYTRREHEKREFLLDLCVIEDHCMDTAVESEWQPDIDAIHYDFEKLLHVKAPLKVLICDSRNYVVEKMKPAVDFLFTRRGSLTPGEVYMIFNYRGNRAFANCHVWTVSDNVLDPSSISFQCVPGFPAEVNNKASIHADGWLA